MDHLFQRWIDLARPHTQLWRVVLGVMLVAGAWVVVSNIIVLLAAALRVTSGEALLAITGQQPRSLSYLDAAVAMGVILAMFGGIWVGVWAVVKWLHQRTLSSVLSHDRSIRPDQFVIGLALAAGYLGISTIAALLSGATASRSTVVIDVWLLALAPLALLIFLQSAGEELFFRGYLVQQLAAKAPSPLIWGFLPSFAFGLVHYFNGAGDPQFGAYYVFAATMLGLVLTATVWRTGGLAVAMGFHLMNNIGAMLVVRVADVTPPISLYTFGFHDAMNAAPVDLLVLGALLAFVLSPFAPLPKGQPLRRKVTRAAP